MGTSNAFFKDPQAVLDYRFDWANTTNGGSTPDWLASGETISSHTIVADPGITVDSDSLTDSNTSVTVWLSGGAANKDYRIACRVVTSAGRTDERSIKIKVRER